MPKATLRTTGKKGESSSEIGFRKTKVALSPDMPAADGFEIPVETSTEKWSEYELQDGTVLKIKQVLIEVIRIEGMYDAEGKPIYFTRAAPIVNIVSVKDNLMKKA